MYPSPMDYSLNLKYKWIEPIPGGSTLSDIPPSISSELLLRCMCQMPLNCPCYEQLWLQHTPKGGMWCKCMWYPASCTPMCKAWQLVACMKPPLSSQSVTHVYISTHVSACHSTVYRTMCITLIQWLCFLMHTYTFMQPDPSEIGEFLNQSCKHGVRNTYCVELWNGLFDPHGSFVSVRQDYTVSCSIL